MQESKKKTSEKSVKLKDVQKELWRRGSLSWKLKGSQKLIETAYNKVEGKLFVSNCSRRFGKSFWAAAKCLEVALKTPNQKIKFASAFANDMEEIIIPAFNFLLDDCPLVKGDKQMLKLTTIYRNSGLSCIACVQSPSLLTPTQRSNFNIVFNKFSDNCLFIFINNWHRKIRHKVIIINS